MSWKLVWYNLIHDKRRTLVGILGVSFAAILMLMQLGFLEVVRRTATSILDRLDFDILVVSTTYHYLYDSGSFPRFLLDEVQSVPGVREAVPLYVGFDAWSREVQGPLRGEASAPSSRDSEQRAVFTLGFNLSDLPFVPAAVEGLNLSVMSGDGRGCVKVARPEGLKDLPALKPPDTILIDRLSHRDYGFATFSPCPAPRRDFWSRVLKADPDLARRPAVKILVGHRPVDLVGEFDLPLGFGADAAILVSDENFSRLFGGRSLDQVSLGLVRVRIGSDPDAVASDLEAELSGDDVRVMTRAVSRDREIAYWVGEQPIGMIFKLGLVIACAVGMVFVYQILSSDITHRFSEYATLKAMGRSGASVSWQVVQLALFLAHGAYFPALLVSVVLERIIRYATLMPIEMTLGDALEVYGATCLVCIASAVLAIGKVRRADPADLFA
ncbi:MAG: FtsX-like permease family protein [Planctomycetaceae bacterium]|nr:FtsX-like permease family protein [Planctomycetaceae bacterium]